MKPTNKKLSLRVYLSCGFLIFSLALILIMWLFQTVFFDSFYRTYRTYQSKISADTIADNIEDEDLLDMLSELEEKNDMEFSVYCVKNNMLSPVYVPQGFMSTHSFINMSMIYQYYQKAIENGGSITIKSDYTELGKHPSAMSPMLNPPLEHEKSEMVTHAIIANTDTDEYLVLAECDIMPVTSTVETLRIQLVIMTCFILVISIFIAVITAHYISKPIHDTTKKAKQLALQNYDLTFSGGNYKELCELNDTLTYSAHELAKVDKLRKELIANISHDLRTPLTMITGYGEVMRDIPGENNSQNIQIIIDESDRLSKLVNDLLDISKLESGAIVMQNVVFNLTECISSIFTRYTKLVEQDGYNLVFENTQDVYINADELRISQVIYNLINNAVNYCGEDKTVIVRQLVLGDKVRIEVEDHGVGIEEENLPYIWDRYYKVDKEHRQAVVGTGLGLSIVKNILIEYNADFGVKSAQSVGSTFWFELKIVNPETV